MGVEWAILASALMGGFGSFTSMQTGVVAYMSSITTKYAPSQNKHFAGGSF